jgi:GGDEF domain-containing protein
VETAAAHRRCPGHSNRWRSVGIALNRTGDSADDILREADLAMYTAKTTGKCRHVLAGSGHRLSEPAESIAARAASSRATGTRNGEQDT